MKDIKTKNKKMGIVFPVLGLAAIAAGVLVGPIENINAATSASDTTTVTVNVGSVIGIKTEDIEINMESPAPAGTFKPGSGDVTVVTNDPTGYSVYLTSNSTTSNTLDHDTVSGAKISSITSIQTIASSTDIFSTPNTWGWSKDGTTFNPIALKGATHTATNPTLFNKTATAATGGDTTTLTVGVTGNSSLTAGTYTGTLLLTAIPNSETCILHNFDTSYAACPGV